MLNRRHVLSALALSGVFSFGSVASAIRFTWNPGV